MSRPSDKLCKYCEKPITAKSYPSRIRKFCGKKCSDLAQVSLTAKLRALKMIDLYRQGFTLTEVAEQCGGISVERARQLFSKQRDFVAEYKRITLRNRQRGFNKRSAQLGYRLSPVIQI